MKTKKILILGKQGVGKNQLANIISKELGVPVVDGIGSLCELSDEEGVYTSNSISLEKAYTSLPLGFMLIYIS